MGMSDEESVMELVIMARVNFENLLKTPGGALLAASPHWQLAMGQPKDAEERLTA